MNDRITIDPSICHGQACVRGTRIPVYQIVHMLAHGDTLEGLLREYPSLTREDILACVEYAASRSKEQTEQSIREFVRRIQALYGDRLKQVVLYGSCARNEATLDSDIDLAIVLAGEVVPSKEIDRMIDAITDINLEHGVLLSVYPVSEDDYQKRNSPLLINIRREGIAV
jgi:uncharacterized protein (DUF433 family)